MKDQETPLPTSETPDSPIQEPTVDDDTHMTENVEEESAEEESAEEEPIDPAAQRRHSPAVKDSRDIYWHTFGS
jgi:hypothetical protein